MPAWRFDNCTRVMLVAGYMWAVPSYDGTAGPPWPTRTPAGTPFSSFAFGCPRNASADNSQYYTSNPYKTDIVPLPPHGWAHVRIRVTNPGVWFLHCHLNIHMLNGMGFIVHAALDRVPRIPSWVDTSCMGTCQACKLARGHGSGIGGGCVLKKWFDRACVTVGWSQPGYCHLIPSPGLL